MGHGEKLFGGIEGARRPQLVARFIYSQARHETVHARVGFAVVPALPASTAFTARFQHTSAQVQSGNPLTVAERGREIGVVTTALLGKEVGGWGLSSTSPILEPDQVRCR